MYIYNYYNDICGHMAMYCIRCKKFANGKQYIYVQEDYKDLKGTVYIYGAFSFITNVQMST